MARAKSPQNLKFSYAFGIIDLLMPSVAEGVMGGAREILAMLTNTLKHNILFINVEK